MLVVRIEPGSPAEKAGIEPGDMVTRAGGIAVQDLHHFHETLKRRTSGQELEIEMLRGGGLVTARPVLGEEP